jgi:predicted Zn-dependent protease with MMP-like domain
MAYRLSKPAFGQLVERALDELPAPFADFLAEVPVEVRDCPTAAQLRLVGVRQNSLLLGLYHGRPITQRSVEDSGRLPDVIYIFQEPIQQVSNSEEELTDQVRKTVLHEIGHHFGMNERELEELGYG